jgi:uncharacterized protein YbaA (DUF1428 family)
VTTFGGFYNFLVTRKNVDGFLRIQQAASEIYQSHGAIEETLALINHEAKYGYIPSTKEINTEEDEEIFVSFSLFPNKTDHDKVMEKIDSDPRIDRLYQEMTGMVDIDRVLRGEFKRVV